MSWNLQEWAVALLILLCIIRIFYGFYKFFHHVRNNDNPCASCASGCELKRQLEKKQQECKEIKGNSNKNCCG